MKYFHLVYDFADRAPNFSFMFAPLLFVAAGIGVYFYYRKFAGRGSVSTIDATKRKQRMLFGIIFASFAGLISIFVISSMLNNYFKTKTIYDNKQYQTVEGMVTNFHPMPESGHDSERFDVNGIQFEFSDFDVSDYGYNNAASHGGVIQEGLKVRIAYFNSGRKNVIIKLETE
jgi:hypothetical protein